MKVFCKLTRNGNATTICIPRRLLDHLRWRAGDPMIVELTDTDVVSIHPPRLVDLRASGVLRTLDNSLPEASK
jgi:antitoxin component of MazEF toxin-antitoxin module